MPDELDLREVRAFLAVVDTGSFLAAARRLSLSQPTVSLQIRRMEVQLAAELQRLQQLLRSKLVMAARRSARPNQPCLFQTNQSTAARIVLLQRLHPTVPSEQQLLSHLQQLVAEARKCVRTRRLRWQRQLQP